MKTLDRSPGSYGHLTTGAQLSTAKVLRLPAHERSVQPAELPSAAVPDHRHFRIQKVSVPEGLPACTHITPPQHGGPHRAHRRHESCEQTLEQLQ